jgi:hypothetical protein
MAVNIPDADYRQDPRARKGSRGVHGNTRHMETAMPSPTEQESKVIGMVLKALSDMGTVKKILNISDGAKPADAVYPKHKPGYRASEKREKTKSRFAGAAAKSTKVPRKYASSVPQPLTSLLSNLIRIPNNLHSLPVFNNSASMLSLTIAS